MVKPFNSLCTILYYPQYYKDERAKEIDRAAAEKQRHLASKKESDERVEVMACTIADLEVTQIALKDNTIERHLQQAYIDVLFK